MNWGTYVAAAVVLLALFGLYRNARLNKGPGGSLLEIAVTAIVVLLIFGSAVLARRALS